jgi:DnaJ homolog subfamily C member 9
MPPRRNAKADERAAASDADSDSDAESTASGPEDITAADEPPKGINPYEELEVARDASDDDIKRAYRRAALRWHPDKVAADQKEAAHSRFQAIALAYAVLSTPHRRARYDATGSTAESIEDDENPFDWAAYYRAQFAEVITPDAIAAFKASYQGSEEEREHVLEAYTECEGDLEGVFERVMCSEMVVDEPRFREWIDAAIKEGAVEGYPAYVKETKVQRARRLKSAAKEEKEAREMARELGVEDKLFGNAEDEDAEEEDEDDVPKKGKKGSKGAAGAKTKSKPKPKKDSESALAALIQGRQQQRSTDFFAQLEAKYAPKGKKGKKGAAEAMDEPPEEAFAAVGARKSDQKKKRKAVEEPEEEVEAPKRGRRSRK